MIRFVIGFVLVIAGTAAIDTPPELMLAGDDTLEVALFIILTGIGLPFMMWGVHSLQGQE